MEPQEMLQAALEAESVAFKRFSDAVSEGGIQGVYCMVEGYDKDFYKVRVDSFFPDATYFVECGGKSKVIALHDLLLIKPEYNENKKLWFVDRDYDDNSSLGPDYYVTDGYSVENYYCNWKTVDGVMKLWCHLDEKNDNHKPIFDAVKADFQTWTSQFIDYISPFCSWYKIAKNRERNDKRDYKDSFPTRLVTIESRGITKVAEYDFNDLNSYYEVNPPVTQAEYDLSKTQINCLNEIRGKYVLEFIEAYLLHLDKTAKKNSPLLKKQFKFSSNRPALMARLSGIVPMPRSLRDYLTANL